MGKEVSKGKGENVGGEAGSMAGLIEKWLGNPFFRRVLGFFTDRSGGERRFEKVLKRYAGEDVDLGLRDRLSYLLVERILDSVVSNAGLEPEEARKNLKQGYWRKGSRLGLGGRSTCCRRFQ